MSIEICPFCHLSHDYKPERAEWVVCECGTNFNPITCFSFKIMKPTHEIVIETEHI